MLHYSLHSNNNNINNSIKHYVNFVGALKSVHFMYVMPAKLFMPVELFVVCECTITASRPFALNSLCLSD